MTCHKRTIISESESVMYIQFDPLEHISGNVTSNLALAKVRLSILYQIHFLDQSTLQVSISYVEIHLISPESSLLWNK